MGCYEWMKSMTQWNEAVDEGMNVGAWMKIIKGIEGTEMTVWLNEGTTMNVMWMKVTEWNMKWPPWMKEVWMK